MEDIKEKIVADFVQKVIERVRLYNEQMGAMKRKASLTGRQIDDTSNTLGFLVGKIAAIELTIEKLQKEKIKDEVKN